MNYDVHELIRLADEVSMAGPDALDDLDRQVGEAMGISIPGRWTQDLSDAILLAALSPDGGGPTAEYEEDETLVKAPLADRGGSIFSPGAGGYSETPAQAIVYSVLRRESYRRDHGRAPRETGGYDDLLEKSNKAWNRLHIKAIRDPELDNIKSTIDSLKWALIAAQARARAAEIALDRLSSLDSEPVREPNP